MLFSTLYHKAKELDVKIHAAGAVEDHVHVVGSIPPKISVAECVKHLKGASSYTINHMPGSDGSFKWQEGYGALSIGERSLDDVIAYAANQKQHHSEQNVIQTYERLQEE